MTFAQFRIITTHYVLRSWPTFSTLLFNHLVERTFVKLLCIALRRYGRYKSSSYSPFEQVALHSYRHQSLSCVKHNGMAGIKNVLSNQAFATVTCFCLAAFVSYFPLRFLFFFCFFFFVFFFLFMSYPELKIRTRLPHRRRVRHRSPCYSSIGNTRC